MTKTVRTCVDPACTWTLTEEPASRIPIERVWAGSVEATVEAVNRQHLALIEEAMRRHIVEDHGAPDPLAWAEAMFRKARADA